jgi:mRNA-degrading endonuclease RelE of RelBE toxin-antitoxin system
MVTVHFSEDFEKQVRKIKNNAIKDQIKTQVSKIIKNPEIGKPMMYGRKGTRELYIKPYRLSYEYIKDEDKIIILSLYHKDEQ